MTKKTKKSNHEINDEIMTNLVEMIHNIDLQLQIMQIDIHNLDVKIDNNYHIMNGSSSLMRERKEGGSL